MRRFAVILALLVLGPAFAGQRLLHEDEKHWIRLYDSPCDHAETLVMIPPSQRAQFFKADVMYEGQRWYGCWAADPDGDVFVIREDGQGALIYRRLFKDEPGI